MITRETAWTWAMVGVVALMLVAAFGLLGCRATYPPLSPVTEEIIDVNNTK